MVGVKLVSEDAILKKLSCSHRLLPEELLIKVYQPGPAPQA